MGRPTDYKPQYTDRAKERCLAGATDADLAEEFEVSVTTIKNWKAKHPEFLAALKLPKEIADERVERSLYERATGYSYNAVKIFCNKDGEVTKVEYVEHVPPDPTAMIFWLKNRKPKEWRDKQEVEHSGGISIAETLAKARASRK